MRTIWHAHKEQLVFEGVRKEGLMCSGIRKDKQPCSRVRKDKLEHGGVCVKDTVHDEVRKDEQVRARTS